MRLTILGSGTNTHPTRAASGYLLYTSQLLLLDFGPRTLMNLMRIGVDRHSITHILFSHYHADHFADFIPFFFDAVFFSNHLGTRPDLTLIGPHGTKKLFRTLIQTLPGFDKARFAVRFKEVSDRSFMIGHTKISPRTVVHSPSLHSVGYRIEYGNKVLAYSGDAQYCKNLIRLCEDANLALLDCSFPANKPGRGHLHAGECGLVAKEASADCLVLSHFYPIADRYNVREQAGERFDGRIVAGKDLMTIKL
ncbi:MAG: Ribonuclease BN [Nitrospira sp.]|nr:Ribonuclease BN [Nitrospira sp.]